MKTQDTKRPKSKSTFNDQAVNIIKQTAQDKEARFKAVFEALQGQNRHVLELEAKIATLEARIADLTADHNAHE